MSPCRPGTMQFVPTGITYCSRCSASISFALMLCIGSFCWWFLASTIIVISLVVTFLALRLHLLAIACLGSQARTAATAVAIDAIAFTILTPLPL
ncbi:hypothetical protein JKP88DRAFT_220155 [Tribonema minus]|uniref:Uncharacterized protein n=1 Tax=Tribonema minus TaxID=303371 RepID=A0A835Z142_9STRA|nr:hypothetical protein JKP88DRAFT_220155 [Tribonema minus]